MCGEIFGCFTFYSVHMWHTPAVLGLEPPPLQKHSASLIGRKIFFIGGECQQTDNCSSDEDEPCTRVLLFDTGKSKSPFFF